MLRNHFKMAWRSLQRQKLYGAINIGGFAVGIAACLLIALYIQHETSYDSNSSTKGVYRLVGEAKQNGITHRGISFPAPMSKAVLADFPEVEKAGRIMYNSLFGGTTNQVRRPDQTQDTYEEGFCFIDTSVLDILNVQMIFGDRTQALKQPFSVVLSKSLADKYFPNQNPVGQQLVFNDNPKLPITVGGVMQDFPSTSHLQYRGFISLAGVNFWKGEQETWLASNYGIYVQLKPNTNVAALEKKLTAGVMDKYMLPAMRAAGLDPSKLDLANAHIRLQALPEIHLRSYNIDEDPAKHGDIRVVWMFTAIALFILLLACINFINLSTARSANRAKEVGLRKVIGSSRTGLVKQFLTESLLYSFISVVLGTLLAVVLLPVFNKMAGTELKLALGEWQTLVALALFACAVGVLSGLYPAFYLSYFKPIETLKGKLRTGSKNAGLRGALVVFQFTVSIVLLMATAVIYEQMNFILNSKTGFDKDQVIVLEGTDALRNHTASFKDELQKLPQVKSVTVSDFLPISGTKRNGNTFWKDSQKEAGVHSQRWNVDEDYISTLGMKLIAGRNFTGSLSSDSATCIVNKAMADAMGFTNPVGKTITNGQTLTIVGVVDNFYFENLKQQVTPLCLVHEPSNSMMAVKIGAASVKGAIGAIENAWAKFQPHQKLRYAFLDDRYAAMYADVQRMQYVFTGFSLLAVIVACLGLFALAAFMAEQRNKEVTIRKVLGASVSSLFSLLAGNFLKLVLVAVLIALPLGWYFMNEWLQDYAYRIQISWALLAAVTFTALLIALLTISVQSLKAAAANPIKSLRTE